VAVTDQLQQESERAARGRGRRQTGVLGRGRQPGGGATVALEEVEAECFDLPVLSYHELMPTLKLDVLDRVPSPGAPMLPAS